MEITVTQSYESNVFIFQFNICHIAKFLDVESICFFFFVFPLFSLLVITNEIVS